MRRYDAIGAVAGAVVGAAVGLIGGGVGVALGAIVGLFAGGAVGVTLQRSGPGHSPSSPPIDPFTVDDPWRRLTQRALSARTRFGDAVGRTPAGPTRDRLATIGTEVDRVVDEVWTTARAGHDLAAAHRDLDAPKVRRRRAAVTDAANDAATIEALDAQLAAADRLAAAIEEARSRLDLLDVRLEEVVARTVELSVGTARDEVVAEVESSVVAIGDELAALRDALADTRSVEQGGTA